MDHEQQTRDSGARSLHRQCPPGAAALLASPLLSSGAAALPLAPRPRAVLLLLCLLLTLGAFAPPAARAQACPTAGLVGFWPFLGDADDASGCAHNGAVSGPSLVADIAGNPSSAYSFTASTDVIDLGTSATLKPALPITLTAQFRHQCSSTCRLYSGDRLATGLITGFWVDIQAGRVIGGYGDGTVNSRTATSSTVVPENVWVHVAVIIRGPADIDILIDGVADSVTFSGGGGPIAYGANPSLIGNADINFFPFEGEIDELRLYDRALSQAEVQTLDWSSRVVDEQKLSDTSGSLSGPGTPGSNPGGLLVNNDYFSSAAALGDINGDSVPDLAVGAYGRDLGSTDAGAVFVLLLNADGSVKSRVEIGNGSPGLSIASGDAFGKHVAAIGDVDGNGVTDLVVGADGDDTGAFLGGAAHILFLNSNGTLAGAQKIAEGVGGGPAVDVRDHFGDGVGAIGDVNGDGVPDVAIGARGDDDAGTDLGALYILLLKGGVGEPNPGEVLGSPIKVTAGQGGFTGPQGGKEFGASAAPLGDIDGDLRPEIAVGNESSNEGAFEAGAVWILSLCSSAAGDANPGEVCGERSLNAVTELTLAPELGPLDAFGAGLASLGDADGDGNVELAVSAPGDDEGGSDQGAVYLLSLRADKTLARLEKVSDMRGGFEGAFDILDNFGDGLSVLGDLSGDGTLEVAVGARQDDDGAIGGNRGAVHILSLDFGSVCGDFVTEPIEACDDGNLTSGDGCSDICIAEFCSDGIVQGGLGETCDDGNIVSGDGCSNVCVVEECGDGVIQAALGESCDDGNTTAGDGCSATCQAEICGDGVLQAGLGESCDDGNTSSNDGCSDLCIVEFCGDGLVQTGLAETCDDGNTTGFDGCSAGCMDENLLYVTGGGVGGQYQMRIAGVTLSVATSPGDAKADVATALAAAINADATLAGMWIFASASGDAIVIGGDVELFAATDTGLALATDDPDAFANLVGVWRTLDFEAFSPGDDIVSGSSAETVAFAYALDGESVEVTAGFEAVSPTQSAGVTGSDQSFLDGDAVTFSFDRPVLGFGLYVVTSDPANAGEIQLTTAQGTVVNAATPLTQLADGGYVYFLALVAGVPLSSASLEFTGDGEINFLYNLDDILTSAEVMDTKLYMGTAVGGHSVSVTIDGVTIGINTVPGDTAADIASLLADAINADSTLSALGTGAGTDGDTLLTNGTIEGMTNTDPGLGGGAPAVPAMGTFSRLLVVMLMVGVVLLSAVGRRDGSHTA